VILTALDKLRKKLGRRTGSLTLPWPGGTDPPPFRRFASLDDWHREIESLGLTVVVPTVVAQKFLLAQKHHLVAWIDLELIKAGEWAAFGALEYALNDRYGWLIHQKEQAASTKPIRFKPQSLAKCLAYMLEHDGLTDERLPFSRKYGIKATEQLKEKGTLRPSLYQRRNTLNHGHLIEALPTSGLLELIRDLIDYAYRDFGPATQVRPQTALA